MVEAPKRDMWRSEGRLVVLYIIIMADAREKGFRADRKGRPRPRDQPPICGRTSMKPGDCKVACIRRYPSSIGV